MPMKWWGWGAVDKEPNVAHMPKFLPYVRQLLGCDTGFKKPIVKLANIHLAAPIEHPAFIKELQQVFLPSQLQQDKLCRLQHSYGKSYRDLARIRQGIVARAPDWVVFPKLEEEVVFLMKAALTHQVCLIPFGGGTNIVGALEVPQSESRMVVSVDLSLMNQVLAVDPVSQTATIQAGAYGPEIEAQLNAQGFSLGHFPDSFEFSTLGGWLATRSVGMQSDQYGTIADRMLGLHCVTPQGLMKSAPYPHASMGPDLNQLILGSEGSLGIITQAVMKVHPLPPSISFGAVLFPSFSAGVAALSFCAQNNQLPHMMRLLDADETQLSFHFKSKKSWWANVLDNLMKGLLGRVRGIDFNTCCLALLAFAGTKSEVENKRKQVLAVCKKQGGIYLGQKPGNDWYQRKYDYPYLRDFMMDLGCVVDVAESAVLWKDVTEFYSKVKVAGYEAMAACIPKPILAQLKKPGYMGCHLSHHYANGTCLYYTFAFVPEEGKALAQYDRVKAAITEAIVQNQGSLSHHHSIGYEHAPWLSAALGSVSLTWLKSIKGILDPKQQLNPKPLVWAAIEEEQGETING